jgi:hypothetical protein
MLTFLATLYCCTSCATCASQSFGFLVGHETQGNFGIQEYVLSREVDPMKLPAENFSSVVVLKIK